MKIKQKQRREQIMNRSSRGDDFPIHRTKKLQALGKFIMLRIQLGRFVQHNLNFHTVAYRGILLPNYTVLYLVNVLLHGLPHLSDKYSLQKIYVFADSTEFVTSRTLVFLSRDTFSFCLVNFVLRHPYLKIVCTGQEIKYFSSFLE